MPIAQNGYILSRPVAPFHPSVVKAMELTDVDPGYLLLNISSMLAMLNDSLNSCLLFGGYALAREIITSDICVETTRLLHKVLSKITDSEDGSDNVFNLLEASGFQTFCDFLEDTVKLMECLKDESKPLEEIAAGLNRFRDDDIPNVLRAIFSAIRGETKVADVMSANPVLRNLSILMQSKHRPELHEIL